MAENPTLPGALAEAPGREFHAVANLFPMLRGAAFEELVANIKKNGLREDWSRASSSGRARGPYRSWR